MGVERPGGAGRSSALLGRRSPPTCPWRGAVTHLTPEQAVKPRREHHRRGGDPGHHLHGSSSPSPRSARRWTSCQQGTGVDVPVHVDGASGGYDRALPATPSSSGTSGCRGWCRSTPADTSTGWPTPGVGWVVWRDAKALPEELVFWVNYLGGDMPTFTLNFSRPGTRSSASTTTSCGWASRATSRSRGTRAPSPRTSRSRSPSWDRSSCSPRATSCRSSPSPSRPT